MIEAKNVRIFRDGSAISGDGLRIAAGGLRGAEEGVPVTFGHSRGPVEPTLAIGWATVFRDATGVCADFELDLPAFDAEWLNADKVVPSIAAQCESFDEASKTYRSGQIISIALISGPNIDPGIEPITNWQPK